MQVFRGKIFIAIYEKGQGYQKDLALKKEYNAASSFKKQLMIRKMILKNMKRRLQHCKNPFTWNLKKARGMNVYHDIIDWLGGLPYEVASEDEIVQFFLNHHVVLQRIKVVSEGSCSTYVGILEK